MKIEKHESMYLLSIKLTLNQWKKLFQRSDRRLFTIGIPFADYKYYDDIPLFDDEFYDIPIVLKQASGYVEVEYRPERSVHLQTEDVLDLNREPKLLTREDGSLWRQMTIHSLNGNYDEFELWQKQGNDSSKICSLHQLKQTAIMPWEMTRFDETTCDIQYNLVKPGGNKTNTTNTDIKYFVAYPGQGDHDGSWRQFI